MRAGLPSGVRGRHIVAVLCPVPRARARLAGREVEGSEGGLTPAGLCAENVQQATKSWVSLGSGGLTSGNPQMGGARCPSLSLSLPPCLFPSCFPCPFVSLPLCPPSLCLIAPLCLRPCVSLGAAGSFTHKFTKPGDFYFGSAVSQSLRLCALAPPASPPRLTSTVAGESKDP